MTPFLLQLLIVFSCFVNGALTEYNALGLLRKYRQHLKGDTKFNFYTFDQFESYLRFFYLENPLECVKLAYKGDWKFRFTFFAALFNSFYKPDENLNNHFFVTMVNDICESVIKNFLKMYRTKEEKEKDFERLELLITIAQEAIPKIDDLGIQFYQTEILILKFLHQNLSYDYERNTIDYHTFFFSLRNTIKLIAESKDPENPSQELINSGAQFIINALSISKNNCMFLFGYQGMDNLKLLALFYIIKYIRNVNWSENYIRDHLQCIKDLIGVFNGEDIMPKIEGFLKESFEFLPECLRVHKFSPRINSITHLEHFINYENIHPCNLWNLNGMIVLEQYLIHNHPHKA